MNYIIKNNYIAIGIVILLLLASIPFRDAIYEERDDFRQIKNTVLIPPSVIKKLSLGYGEIVADIYWIRALQYFGNPEFPVNEKNPDLVYKYFNIITELDPKFVNAYRFGGTFLSEPHPYGMNDLEKGSLILDKGRKNNPDNFRLPMEQAFLYYLYSDDLKKASELFTEASEKPGLTEHRKASFKGMAAAALNKNGDRELAKKIWIEIYNTTLDENRKKFALMNLKELKTMEDEENLTKIAKNFEKIYGRFPENFEDLLNAGYIKEIPRDHNKNNFVIDSKLKIVKSLSLLENQ